MSPESTSTTEIDFLYWEADPESGEIKQYGFVKNAASDRITSIMNRAALDIDGCIGVIRADHLGGNYFILLMDPIKEVTNDERERKVHTKRELFAQRVYDRQANYVPLSAESIAAGMAIHSSSPMQDKLEMRGR